MTEIEFKAHVPKSRELTFQLPEEFQEAEVEVHVKVVPKAPDEDATSDERPWTDEEIKEMMRPEPKTGKEIVESDAIGGWEHMGITDSVAFIEELRRKRREKLWRRD